MIIYENINSVFDHDDDIIDGKNFSYENIFPAGTYYIEAYCNGDQAEYQMHMERVFFAKALPSDEYNINKGDSQKLQVFAWSAEDKETEFEYHWFINNGSELVNNSDDPSCYTAENVQTYTEILCRVSDQSGHEAGILFKLHVRSDSSLTEEELAAAQVIKAGNTEQVSVDPESSAQVFKFVPEETSTYTFYTPADEDSAFYVTYLYDSDFNLITDVIESDSGCTFIGQEGETYYIKTRFYDFIESLTYTLSQIENGFFVNAPDDCWSIEPGEPTTFEVTAWSVSNLHYQWSYNSPLRYDQNEDPLELTGETGASYTPDSPKSGYYCCKVWDDDGHSGEVTFNLTVNSDLDIYDSDSEVTCSENDSLSLEVNVEASDDEGIQYIWEKYDRDSDKWTVIEGASGISYTTPQITYHTTYRVTAIDRYNNYATKEFEVSIGNEFSAAPVRHEDDPNETLVDGVTTLTLRADQPVTSVLEVKAGGTDTDKVTYEWGCKSGNFSTVTLGETSNKCTPTCDGYYFCRVTDKFGNSVEVTFRVIIENDLKLTSTEDITVEVLEGRSAPFTVCGAALNPDSILYRWYQYDEHGVTIFLGETSENTYMVTPTAGEEKYFCFLADTYRHYNDHEQVNFTVKKVTEIDLSKAEVTVSPENLTYNGKAQKPAVTVKYDLMTLEYGTDYTLSYKNNTNAGTATVTITGKGNCTGSISKTFTIKKASIAGATVSGIASKTYNGNAQTQSPTVTLSGTTLKSGTDYTLSYQKNTDAGTATVTITGKGNYTGSISKTFSIRKAGQTLVVKAKAPKIAVGKTTTVTVTGAKGTKTYRSNNTEVATVSSSGVVTGKKTGKVIITVTSKATTNYVAASKSVTVYVTPAATTKITATNLETGIKVNWVKVTGATGYLLYRNGTKIAELNGIKKVTYTDKKANTNGTKYNYKVVAKSTYGNSTLSKSVSACRLSRPTVKTLKNSASKKMTATWSKNAKAEGYQLQCSTDRTFRTSTRTIKIKSAYTLSKVIDKLTKGKTYYVRIRSYQGSFRSAWSAIKSVKITK